MIYLFTGAIGASKTLNAIKFVCEQTQFKNRPVYYFNIRELNLPWNSLDSIDQVKTWFDLPEGSVIFLDECQDIFPPRKVGAAVPTHVSKMNTSRHGGYDFILVTQHPRLIDTAVRQLVNQHIHIERRFGQNRAHHYRWEKTVSDVDDYHKRKEALHTKVALDKKYFGVYKSAEQHTVKNSVPRLKLAGVAIGLLSIFGFLFFGVSHVIGPGKTSPEPIADSTSSSSFSDNPSPFRALSPSRRSGDVDLSDPLSFKPVDPSLPWTAPAYAQNLKINDYPRPQCYYLHTSNVCRCFTQQATPLQISMSDCLNIVHHGYFDPFRKPESSSSEGLTRRRAGAAPSHGPRITYINHRNDRTVTPTRFVDR